MELLKRSRERRRFALLAFALALVLLLALAYTAVSSQAATDKAIESVSEVYLEELSDQVIAHFDTSIDNRFGQMRAVGTSLAHSGASDEGDVCQLLRDHEADGDCTYLGLRTDDGRYYTSRGLCDNLDATLADADAMVFYLDSDGREMLFYEGTIVLVEQIAPVACGNIRFTAVVAGYGIDELSDRFGLDLFSGSSRSSMIASDGTCIADGGGELEPSDNIFDMLDEYAQFDKGHTVEQLRDDVSNGRVCLVPFTYGSRHEYLYFRPVGSGD